MSLDIPILSRRVIPAGNVNIAGREMLDSLSISTQITTSDVEWKKQWLQARYKDEDLFYARHRIQGQPSLEEYLDFIKQYEGMRNHKKSFAELTNELTKSKIELESNSRFFQTLPFAFPNRNAYADELRNQNDKLALQFRRKDAQHSTEIDQLKRREAQLSAEIDQGKEREAKLSGEINQLKRKDALLFTEIEQAKGREAQLSAEIDRLRRKEAHLLEEKNHLANANGHLKNENAKLSEKIDKMMTRMMQMFFKWQTEL